MREVVFDTETTGVDPQSGDRVVEIGCLELENHIPTGRTYHVYLNPERAMPADAFVVHGLSDAFLADKHLFRTIADELRAFLGDAQLVAHNAAFDIGFLNAEFARTGHPPLPMEGVVDTLALARRKHPNAGNSLDALCGRYSIDLGRRVKHGALLDSELLAEVYIELLGGRQKDLGLSMAGTGPSLLPGAIILPTARAPRPERVLVSAEELAQHAAFVSSLGENALWRDYMRPAGNA